ncbi:hypothetical protein [Leifsonia kafniensis]|uniref:hypothetical protein n=1 Tax=Leifsonia kafniensis TaxID=475957 RepID=UPI0031E5F20B
MTAFRSVAAGHPTRATASDPRDGTGPRDRLTGATSSTNEMVQARETRSPFDGDLTENA